MQAGEVLGALSARLVVFLHSHSKHLAVLCSRCGVAGADHRRTALARESDGPQHAGEQAGCRLQRVGGSPGPPAPCPCPPPAAAHRSPAAACRSPRHAPPFSPAPSLPLAALLTLPSSRSHNHLAHAQGGLALSALANRLVAGYLQGAPTCDAEPDATADLDVAAAAAAAAEHLCSLTAKSLCSPRNFVPTNAREVVRAHHLALMDQL